MAFHSSSNFPIEEPTSWSIAGHDAALPSNPSIHHTSPFENQFFTFAGELCVEREEKLKEVRQMLSKVGEEDPLEALVAIDAIQCLGIDYHFQKEINGILQTQNVISKVSEDSRHDLYETALRFRLLRQEGHYVPADIFNKFKDNEGKFKRELGEDINGLMGLYEASHVRIEEDDELEEAEDFCRQLFIASMPFLDSNDAKMVKNTLINPYRKSLSRFGLKNFPKNNFSTSTYKWMNVLQELARTELNVVQSIHQKELLHISKWWKDLGLDKELKLTIRDQPLKWHMWSMAVLTDPSLSEQRVELTKPISLVHLIDDIFDVYGTLNELTLFTEAVNRWELAEIDQLPNYMKTCFNTLVDTTNEIGYKFFKVHGWNPIDALQKSWASLCNAFMEEAKWFASKELPKAEEYLKNGVMSTGVHVVFVHMFFLLGHGLTKECVDLMNDNNIPGITYFPAKILRLWDDLGSAKDENQDGHDGSYLEYYMKEHKGSSVKAAKEHIMGMISESWKCLNKECLSPSPFSASYRKACLNGAKMVSLMYNYDDNHCLPGLEEHMKSLIYTTSPS